MDNERCEDKGLADHCSISLQNEVLWGSALVDVPDTDD